MNFLTQTFHFFIFLDNNGKIVKIPINTQVDVGRKSAIAYRMKKWQKIIPMIKNLKILIPNNARSFASFLYHDLSLDSVYKNRNRQVQESIQIVFDLKETMGDDYYLVFPETDIKENANEQLHVQGHNIDFQGTIIVQEIVEIYSHLSGENFGKKPPIEYARGVVEKQILLWNYGFGIISSREAYGPIDWGRKKNGEIVLVDQTGITRDRNNVLAKLHPQQRTSSKQMLIKKLIHAGINEKRAKDQTEEYHAFIEKNLNVDVFSKNWNSRNVSKNNIPSV